MVLFLPAATVHCAARILSGEGTASVRSEFIHLGKPAVAPSADGGRSAPEHHGTPALRPRRPTWAGDLKQWLDDFRAEHGRPPRLLHVGNIANNAYNNAKLLNEAGLDCDVLCHDYYHIMGCPEWQDADFQGEVSSQFFPDWTRVDLKGFRRPRWFVQGPVPPCIAYLLAKRRGRRLRQSLLWWLLSGMNRTSKWARPAAWAWQALRVANRKASAAWRRLRRHYRGWKFLAGLAVWPCWRRRAVGRENRGGPVAGDAVVALRAVVRQAAAAFDRREGLWPRICAGGAVRRARCES